MSPLVRHRARKSRQTFSGGIWMREEGASMWRRARRCANRRAPIFDPNKDFKTMPYNARARASWRMSQQGPQCNNLND